MYLSFSVGEIKKLLESKLEFLSFTKQPADKDEDDEDSDSASKIKKTASPKHLPDGSSSSSSSSSTLGLGVLTSKTDASGKSLILLSSGALVTATSRKVLPTKKMDVSHFSGGGRGGGGGGGGSLSSTPSSSGSKGSKRPRGTSRSSSEEEGDSGEDYAPLPHTVMQDGSVFVQQG